MINRRELLTLFPTYIAEVFVEDEKLLKDTRKNVLKILKPEMTVTQTDRSIWTTEDALHLLPEFKDLKDLIDDEVKRFIEEIHGINFDDIKMTNMWSNVHNHMKNKHHIHYHRNSFISGVIYVSMSQDPGNIFFCNPTLGDFIPDSKYETHAFSGIWTVYPKLGTLLLFNSNLKHGTNPGVYKKGEYRISISFNYMLLKNKNYSTGRFDFTNDI